MLIKDWEKVKALKEAKAIKNAIDNLNKKLGKKTKAKIKRTQDMEFLILI